MATTLIIEKTQEKTGQFRARFSNVVSMLKKGDFVHVILPLTPLNRWVSDYIACRVEMSPATSPFFYFEFTNILGSS
jgi:hypothetical protein